MALSRSLAVKWRKVRTVNTLREFRITRKCDLPQDKRGLSKFILKFPLGWEIIKIKEKREKRFLKYFGKKVSRM